MKRSIQFLITAEENGYVAICNDLPIVTQGDTLDELAANIREATELHLEGEDLSALGLEQNTSIVMSFDSPETALA